MSILFTPFTFKNITLKNRFVRSATHTGFATDDGMVTDASKDVLFTLAENNVGLIITGHAYISPEGKASSKQLGIYNDECIKGLFEITQYIHAHTTSKIFAQISHAGAQTTEKVSGHMPIGPSDIEKDGIFYCKHMNDNDIEKVIEDFAQAAMRVKEAKFDGLQIHAAHGYLLSQFLSPYFNKRTDSYGGTLKNRAKFPCLVIEKVRKKVGDFFPIMIKINSEDFMDKGFKLEDLNETIGYLINSGFDAIEISGGTSDSVPFVIRKGDPTTEEEQFYYRNACKQIREKYEIPLIAMGGIREFSVAEKIIDSNQADLISMSRPFVCEPSIISRWKDGEIERSKCVSCNACFRPLVVGKGLRCKFNKEV